jgi:hypothetical protein
MELKFSKALHSIGTPKGTRNQQLLLSNELTSFQKESTFTKRVVHGEDANEAVSLAPDYGLPYLARPAIWKAIGNTEQQMADCRQALVLQPELAELDLDN